MSNFDPITFTAARDARAPLGAVLPAFQLLPSSLPPGWAQLDGSLVSREAYPDATKALGDVRFFGLAPTEVQTDLVMRAGVQSVAISRVLAIPGSSTILAAGASIAPAATNIGLYRLWRSVDAGGSWAAVDLPAFAVQAEQWQLSFMEWFGGGRVLLVLSGENTGGGSVKSIVACYSADGGATWTVNTVYSAAISYANVHSVAASAEMALAGTGVYAIGYQYGNGTPATGALCVINPASGVQANANVGADGANTQYCYPFGARDLGSGSHEVHYGRSAGGVTAGFKMTFNGAALGAESGSGITGIAGYVGNGLRSVMAAGADGNHYVANASAVMRMPASWVGALTLAHTGLDNVNQRLLTNTLSNPNTGLRYDINTATASPVPGMAAGRGKVGTYWGHVDRVWQGQTVADLAPSVDRHFANVNALAGSFAVRTSRIADNFVSGLGESADAARFLGSATGLGWVYTAAGQLRFIAGTGSPTKLSVKTYPAANDYATYAHVPYLPGLVARLR